MRDGQWSWEISSSRTRDPCYGMPVYLQAHASYPVKKEVGKVGEDSPLFIVPLDSAENKSNIANFFSKPASPVKPKFAKDAGQDDGGPKTPVREKRKMDDLSETKVKEEEFSPTKIKIIEDVKGQSPVKTPQRKPTKRPPPPTKKSPVKKEANSKITNFFVAK